MDKERLWKAFCDGNPSFARPDAHVTMTARGLRKLFDQTYDRAYEQGKVAGRLLGKLDNLKEKVNQALRKGG